MSARLSRRFFARPSTVVAPALLGRVLVRGLPTGEHLRVRIVETEAYDETDPASHSFRGPTARNAVMFGEAGHLYVYFVYGMHHCMNVVTGPSGRGSAVLIRAAEPLDGLERMREYRGATATRDLCRGPARLTRALAVDRSMDGVDLITSDALWIEEGRPVDRGMIESGVRVGIRLGLEHRWRFIERGSSWVSPGPRSTPTGSARASARGRPSRR
jgi:DNA-3-methyladenine glycosylase